MGARFTGLWRHADFLKLWAGQTVSLFGSLITRFALPLVAVLTLEATPFQVAAISALEVAPGLLVGLFAGVWVDRLRRRPILIATDLARALLLGSVPLAALLGRLRIEHLYVVAFGTSLLSLFFEVAYRSYLPTLVRREELVEGNSKLQASGSVAEVAGFGLAGLLVQLLTAPMAIMVDALTFVVSAVSLLLIRRAEPPPSGEEHAEAGQGVWREIGQGLATLWRMPAVRAIAGATATDLFFIHIFVAVLFLFFVRELRLPPALMGALFAIGGVSALIGALFAERVTRRFGLGRTMLGTLVLNRLATFFIPLAGGPLPLASALVAAEQTSDGIATIYQINQTSLLQTIVPDRLQGRVNASLHVLEQSAMLLGLLVGGFLGQAIGLRPTLFVGISGALLAVLWLYFSPIRAMRDFPTLPSEQGQQEHLGLPEPATMVVPGS